MTNPRLFRLLMALLYLLLLLLPVLAEAQVSAPPRVIVQDEGVVQGFTRNVNFGGGLVATVTAGVATVTTGGPYLPTTFTSNGVLYGATTGSILATTQGAANSVLTANAGAPLFSATPTLTSLTLTTDLTVPNGGTGVSTFTANGVVYGNTAGVLLVTAQGAANTVLTANAGAPAFSAAPTIGTSVTVPLILGGTAANGDLTIEGTSSATKTTSYVNLQTTGGFVGIGTTAPNNILQVANYIEFNPTSFSTLIGSSSGAATSSFQINNTAVGYEVFPTANSTSFDNNTGIGYHALYAGTSGSSNMAVGTNALEDNTSGSSHVAVGSGALGNLTGTGSFATGIGTSAGKFLSDLATPVLSASESFFMGGRTSPLADADTNEIVIGYLAVGFGSNTATLGNANILYTALRGNVGIGQAAIAGITSRLMLPAGTATAGTSPLGFTSGPVLTVPVPGNVEFLTDAWYGTITTGAVRKTFAFLESPAFVTPNLGTPSAGVVTNLTGTASININGTVGGTTPAAGAFTTASTTGQLTGVNVVLSGPLDLIATGAAPKVGSATLGVGGTVTVNTTAATATAHVFFQRKTSGGTIGMATTYTVNAGTSFTVSSDNVLDTSTFSWWIVETH